MLAVQKIKKIKRDKDSAKRATAAEDIIVYKKENEVINYNEDGSYTVRSAFKKINLSKYVNETKKLIKTNSAEEKLKELAKAVLKG